MKLIKHLNRLLQRERALVKYNLKLLLVNLHAFVLVILTILLQYSSMIKADETILLKWGAVLRHNIFRLDPKPDWEHVAFIDISKDLSLGDDNSDYDGGKRVLTDRVKLFHLFKEFSTHRGQYKYVICDVLFDKSAPGDDSLKTVLGKVDKLITTAIWEKHQLIKPIFNVNYGVVNYKATEEVIFAKLPVYYEGNIPSLPAKVYEQLTGESFQKKMGMTILNGRLCYNAIIPEFYYRPADLIRGDGVRKPNTFYLGQLLYDQNFFNDVLKDKFIIIGDFSKDIHSTYLENIPGPLILWDTFLTMREHPPIVSIGWLIILFVVYFLISYWIIMHPERKLEDLHQMVKVPIIKEFFIRCVSFLGLMILLDLISFVFFGTFISLFYLASYLTFMQLLIDKWPEFKRKVFKLSKLK